MGRMLLRQLTEAVVSTWDLVFHLHPPAELEKRAVRATSAHSYAGWCARKMRRLGQLRRKAAA